VIVTIVRRTVVMLAGAVRRATDANRRVAGMGRRLQQPRPEAHRRRLCAERGVLGHDNVRPARYTLVFQKIGDAWLIIGHHSSRVPEP
jgi:hypothetical protein